MLLCVCVCFCVCYLLLYYYYYCTRMGIAWCYYSWRKSDLARCVRACSSRNVRQMFAKRFYLDFGVNTRILLYGNNNVYFASTFLKRTENTHSGCVYECVRCVSWFRIVDGSSLNDSEILWDGGGREVHSGSSKYLETPRDNNIIIW